MIATKVLTAIFVLLLLTVRSLQQMVEGEQGNLMLYFCQRYQQWGIVVITSIFW